MRSDPWTLEAARRTRRTLYRLAGFYVVLGIVVAFLAVMAGDRVSVFLGFLIVGGTLAATVALNSLLRLTDTTLAMLAEIRERLTVLESPGIGTVFDATEDDVDSTTIDVAAGGMHDPSIVAAGTLDSSKFPRLVAGVVEFDDPYQAEGEEEPEPVDPVSAPWSPAVRFSDELMETRGWVSPTANAAPMRKWRVALHRGDLEGCRAAYDQLVSHVSAVAAETLEATLRELEQRIEQRLRRTFAEQVRSGSYGEAIETGDNIVHLFPAGRAAADFKRLRDVLTDRAADCDSAIYAEAQ